MGLSDIKICVFEIVWVNYYKSTFLKKSSISIYSIIFVHLNSFSIEILMEIISYAKVSSVAQKNTKVLSAIKVLNKNGVQIKMLKILNYKKSYHI